MRPLKLTLTDFRSVTGTIDFSNIRLAALVGQNGAGKSSVLLAMRVALYGNKAYPSLDRLIRWGAQGFMDDFEFEVDDRAYRVVREVGKLHKASLFKASSTTGAWESICEAKVSDVDAAIVRILGCTYEEFTLTAHLPQGALGAFAAKDPAARKEWLMGNLPMGRWTALEAAAKAEVTTVKNAIMQKEAARDTVLGEEYDPQADEFELHQLTETLSTRQKALDATEKHIASARITNERYHAAEVDRVRAVSDEIAAQLAHSRADEAHLRAQAALSALTSVLEQPEPENPHTEDLITKKAELAEKQRGADRLASELFDARNALLETHQTVDARTGAAERAINALADHDLAEDTICPTCHQPVEAQAKAYVRESLVAAIDTANEELEGALEADNAAAERVSGLSGQVGALEAQSVAAGITALERAIADARNIDSQRALRAQAAEKLSDAEEALGKAEEGYAVTNDVYQDARQHRIQCDTARDGIERFDLTEAETSRRELTAAITAAQVRQSELTSRIERAQGAAKRAEVLRLEVVALFSQQTILELLVKAYSKNGIPARIIEGSLAQIETHTNAFLAQFTDGLEVTFATQKENKTGGTMKETLDIQVSSAAGTALIDDYSGGEKTRVNFALAIGIGQFLAANGGGRIESFSIDEVDALDKAGEAELVACLHMLSHSVPCVLLVSHIEGLAEAMPQRVTVRKGSTGSVMEVSE